MNDAQVQQKAFRDNCECYRKGHQVFATGSNKLMFDGAAEKHPWSNRKYTPNSAPAPFKGINAAKRFCRNKRNYKVQ